MTRKGKIALLPHSIREQINLRLRDSRPASEILAWLDEKSLSQMRALLPLSNAVVKMRQGDHCAARLHIQRQRRELYHPQKPANPS